MDTISASEAKNEFSALLDKVQTEPVIISKHGRAVAVVMSVGEFDKHLSFRRDGPDESNQPVGLRRPIGEPSQADPSAHVMEEISAPD